ncbi:MAG: alpha-hydroxy-acid oxidizing protein [Xanthobacteraceae bacterium]|nr:alpha-hydroxy-acid oxidizing protein [Xanthobacteraceae bacterium]
MDDTTAATAATVPATQQAQYRGGDKLRTLYPTIAYLRERARRHIPHFAFEYSDGGAGTDGGIRRNWAGLDAVELVPRYGVMPSLPPVNVELFGRKYAAPLGIPPMGGPAIVWPGADSYMAEAAQRARVPYTLGTVGGITIEKAAELAPDVLWFQLYRMARNDHWLGFELMRRCAAAGVHVMVMTVDVPVRTVRPREVVVGMGGSKFSAGPRMIYEMLRSPGWLMSLWQNGQPRFANIRNYAGEHASVNEVISFARSEIGGAFTWEEIARYRDKWKGPLALKGIMHPADAERAIALGIDGIWVSNHGGRQIEALPAPIDVLPAIASQVGSRATVLFDSGVRSGLDVVRALALGAHAAFAGKAFLWGLGALGGGGPKHVIDLLIDETRASLGQIGAKTPADARSVVIRHPGVLAFPPV